jgi:hypothetical protein
MYSLGGILNRGNGDVISVSVRRTELNRDGGPHAISDVPMDVDNVELRYSRGVGAGKISVGIGYEDPPTGPGGSSRVHGFATWQQGF